jgi:predicted AAA+ superfamily ATPase
LDIPSTAELAQNNPDLFLSRYKPPLIVDEVQYAPKLFRHLKVWIDQNRKLKGQIILTGSQKFILMKEVSESLAGRVGIVEMEPLTVSEVLQDTKLNETSILGVMDRGLFPELWQEKTRSHKEYYKSYLSTYIERDIRQLININNLLDFEKFIRICASRSGQILNKSEVAKDVGVTLKTITSWLSALEASNQIVLLQPYFENFGKRLVKSPKLYFCDTGFLMYLLSLDLESAIEYPIIGSIWETFVFNELRKQLLISSSTGQLFYYRDNQAREVDVLFVNKGRVHFIETKWTTNPDKKAMTSLHKVANDLKSRTVKKGKSFVIARNRDPIIVDDNSQIVSMLDFDFKKLL